MQNGLKIKWTEESVDNLNAIIGYLQRHWTNKELTDFFSKLEKQLVIISLFPEAFPLFEEMQLRRCVLTKQTSINYIIEEQHVVILSLFDNRKELRSNLK
jgi:plasmid stabilization system protein ParE